MKNTIMQSLTSQHYDIIACMVTHRTPFDAVERTVDSLLTNSLNVGVIIVDDGSGDGYVEALEEELGNLVSIITISQRRGLANAYNRALTQAPPSDSFIIISPNAALQYKSLGELHSQIKSNNNIGLVAPKLEYENGEIFLSNRLKPTITDLFCRHFIAAPLQVLAPIKKHIEHYQMLDVGYDKPCSPDYLDGNIMCFNRKIIERLGGFESQFGDYLYDADITLRAKAISSVLYYPKAVATLFPDINKKTFRDRIDYFISLWRFSFVWGMKWW